MIRRLALLGCRAGVWIRTYGLNNLVLDAQVHQDSMLKVVQRDGGELRQHVFVGPGKHNIPSAEWTQVHISDGPFEHSICQLVGS